MATTVTRYKVYSIENGLLIEPQSGYYGEVYNKYDVYDTIEEAQEAIARKEDSRMVILPSVSFVRDTEQ